MIPFSFPPDFVGTWVLSCCHRWAGDKLNAPTYCRLSYLTSDQGDVWAHFQPEPSKSQVQFWVLPFYSGTVGVSGLCRTVQNKLWVEVQTDLVADAPHISLQGINGFPINRKEKKTRNTQSRWGNHLFNKCSDVQTACFPESAIKPASSPLRLKFNTKIHKLFVLVFVYTC